MDTEARITAVRRRLRELQTEEATVERKGRPCTECIFGPINDNGRGRCDHIVHWQRRHDTLNGRWKGRLEVTTAEARSEDGLCGPEGLLFQPYSLKGRAFRWLSQRHAIIWLWILMAAFFIVTLPILWFQGKL